MYMVVDKENNTMWAAADSCEKIIAICKFLKKNTKGSDAFYVVWTGKNKIEELPFPEFCTLKEI